MTNLTLIQLDIRRLLLNNRFILSGTALIITFAIFSICQLNYFIYTFQKGNYYLSYQTVFLPLMFLVFQYYIKRQLASHGTWYAIIIFGILSGYISGLIAAKFNIIFVPYGWRIFLNSITVDHCLFQFFPPLLFLSWLFGGLMGYVVYILRKWAGHGTTARTA